MQGRCSAVFPSASPISELDCPDLWTQNSKSLDTKHSYRDTNNSHTQALIDGSALLASEQLETNNYNEQKFRQHHNDFRSIGTES
jgi:hypothetical protein